VHKRITTQPPIMEKPSIKQILYWGNNNFSVNKDNWDAHFKRVITVIKKQIEEKKLNKV
jgi:hypothetical protein